MWAWTFTSHLLSARNHARHRYLSFKFSQQSLNTQIFLLFYFNR